jgi:hypothetical protein
MSSRSPVLESLIATLPTPHPAILLIPASIVAYMAVPIFADNATTASVPAALHSADPARAGLPGAGAPDANFTPDTRGGSSVAVAPALPSPVIIPGGAVMSSGGAGNYSSGGSPAQQLNAARAHDAKVASAGAQSQSPRRVAPPMIAHPATPPVRIAPIPPRPVLVPAPQPPIARPPVIFVPPPRIQPFVFRGPMVVRPFMGGGAHRR